MADDELTLGADFPAADEAAWRALVDGVLKGAPFEKRLVTTTGDGLRVDPLYVDGDGPGPDAAGVPGAAPFVRGGSAAAAVAAGWQVRQYHSGVDPDAVNQRILLDLERGVQGIVLGPLTPLAGGEHVEPTAELLERALAGVLVEIAPVALDWGPDARLGAELFRDLVRRRGLDGAGVDGELGLDPLGDLARHGWSALPLDRGLTELARTTAEVAAELPRVRTVRVDASTYADAGAPPTTEIACALATGVAYLRALTAAGLDVDTALGQIAFRLVADADQFSTLTKLRAARRCWARVAEACGASGGAGAMSIHAVTACAMYSRRDPWVNLLRATLACFAAAAGGADAVTVLPFGAAAGQWDELGERLARNTQIILAEESGLHRVADPAGGSWYVEARTEALAGEAWRRFQEIERAGGMADAIVSGRIGSEVAAAWEARRADLATRRAPLTGVSEFPDLDELELPVTGSLDARIPAPGDAAVTVEPLPLRRLAAPFEALRDRADELASTAGARPAVFLANLGPVATHTARATFAKNFFEVAGIRALGNSGFDSTEAVVDAFRASGAERAVLCSSDAVYAERAEDTARALKAAGCRTVYLAGAPGDARAAYEAAGVDDFVFVGADLLDVLGRALAV